jgi:hypothetical protein
MIANVRRFAIDAGSWTSDTVAVSMQAGRCGATGRARLLEAQAAVGAGAVDERRRRPARRAGRLVAGQVERHRRQVLALELRAPVAVQQLAERGDARLLDQEVRPRASTLAAAGRAPDQRRDTRREAPIAQRLHFGDRARGRGDEGLPGEQALRVGRGHGGHGR